jgi:ribosomal protein L11 methyltransferase
MDKFWVVTIFNFLPSSDELERVESLAMQEYDCLGIEEFSMNEEEVDALLGERSYSGGDLPSELINEVDAKMLASPCHYRFFFSLQEKAQGFFETMKPKILAEMQIESQDSQDWNAEWKKHYDRIWVNHKIEVIPSWLKEISPKSEKQLYIYPGMGFGTGSHETTYLCLKLFSENLDAIDFADCLDFGSGSGILGICALSLNQTARVDFYDIDPEANKNCYENVLINQLDQRLYRLLLPEFRSSLLNQYQLIFANILEGVLLSEKQNLFKHLSPNGHLIISGLLTHQVSGVIEAYLEQGLTLVKQVHKGDWGAVLFRKEFT